MLRISNVYQTVPQMEVPTFLSDTPAVESVSSAEAAQQ